MELSKEQRFVVDKIVNSLSGFHFITGKAGTGKSTIVNHLKELGRTVVVAPTGIAAINVGGQTIHSFFKISPKPFTPKEGRAIAHEMFMSFDTMIIDEISMVRVDLMNYISQSLKRSDHEHKRPFGGKKIVAVGDLSQLPPIVKTHSEDEKILKYHYKGKYFFKAKIFEKEEIKIYRLGDVFRQQDGRFLDIVNNLRYGKMDPSDIDYINSKIGKCGNSITRLCTTNKSVNAINTMFLNGIAATEYEFEKYASHNFKSEPPAPEILKIKEGAKVMFLANIRGLFVNGEIGIVKKIDNIENIIVVVKENGVEVRVKKHEWTTKKYSVDSGKLSMEETAYYKQYPLKLAYAITIHKSQGITMVKGHIDVGNGCFSHGQLYVALSRLKSDEYLTLEKPINYSDIIYDREINDIAKSKYKLLEYAN